MKKVLVFGHIPKWFGGKQSSGLSNGMYLLAFNMANFTDSLNVSFVATDLHKETSSKGKLKIYGWSIKTLITYILGRLFAAIGMFFTTCAVYSKLYNISIFNLYIKRILLKKYIAVVKPDLIHLHGVNSCYLIDVVPENIKIIVTMHHCLVNDHSVKNNVKFRMIEEKICNSKRIDAILFITSQVSEEFNALYGPPIPKSKVILQGYESEKYYHIDKNIENDKITLCSVGSLAERKGQMRVIEALKSFNTKFNYICIGGGTKETIEELVATANKHNIAFEYKGIIETEKIREIMASVDFMILPSIKEGFGITYIESIACGVPVIAPNNTPLVQENILNKSNSLLIESESVESIKACLKDLELFKFDSNTVSQSLPNLGWKDIAKEYEELILSL